MQDNFDGTGASVGGEVAAKFSPLLKVAVAYWSISDFVCLLTVYAIHVQNHF